MASLMSNRLQLLHEPGRLMGSCEVVSVSISSVSLTEFDLRFDGDLTFEILSR